MKNLTKPSRFASVIVIVIGFSIFCLATWKFDEPDGAALGVFFILLGFNFLTNLRISKLEQEIRRTKER